MTDNAALDATAIVEGLAAGIAAADARQPVAVGARTGNKYAPGIGPHTESETLRLALAELGGRAGWEHVAREIPYPGTKRARCDLAFGVGPEWEWCVEVKMLRLMGDNGKPNDNMLMHILSPYPQHRSALTDCQKLVESGLLGRKAIVIFGYDYDALPMDPAIEAFETLASTRVALVDRAVASVEALTHPVHQRGRVFGWSIACR